MAYSSIVTRACIATTFRHISHTLRIGQTSPFVVYTRTVSVLACASSDLTIIHSRCCIPFNLFFTFSVEVNSALRISFMLRLATIFFHFFPQQPCPQCQLRSFLLALTAFFTTGSSFFCSPRYFVAALLGVRCLTTVAFHAVCIHPGFCCGLPAPLFCG